MNLYMIRDKGTDRWYKKGYGGGTWVPQELASIWTTPNGPGGAKANIDRYNKRATLVTSQLPMKNWHDYLGDATMADAILDRLVHNAHKLPLTGESMRKKTRSVDEG